MAAPLYPPELSQDGIGVPPLPTSPQPQPSQQAAPQGWGQVAPILALLPLILKRGGPQGVAAFMSSLQAAQAQKRQQQAQEGQLAYQQTRQTSMDTAQQQRQAAIDAREVAQDAWQREYQQGQLTNTQTAQRTAFIDQFTEGLKNSTSDQDVAGLVEAYAQFGAPLGVARESLDKIARQIASADQRTGRRVQALLKGADKDLVQQWVTARGNLMVDGQPVPFEQWSKHLAIGVDPQGQMITPKADTGAFTLGTGQTRFNADGTPLASGPESREPRGPQPGFEWVKDAKGVVHHRQPRPGDTKYDPVSERQAAGATSGPSAYATERGIRTVQSVDELLSKVTRWTTGFGSALARIPETDARNFRAELDTLKANIAFNELTQMREASKTGGALGQVSNIELGLLQSALGALDAGQSPANLRAQLQKIKASVTRWNAAQAQAAISSPVRQAPPVTDGNPFRR